MRNARITYDCVAEAFGATLGIAAEVQVRSLVVNFRKLLGHAPKLSFVLESLRVIFAADEFPFWQLRETKTMNAAALRTFGSFASLLVAFGTISPASAQVLCWGYASDGTPNVPSNLGTVRQIDVGTHAIALKADGTVQCWGNNSERQCNVPAGISNIVQVSAGEFHSLVLRSNGTVACWGWNVYGQSTAPSGLSGVTQISAGAWHNMALRTDGSVSCWGYNFTGACTAPFNLLTVKQVSGGQDHSAALKTDGTVVLWGSNSLGQLSAPAGLASISQISCGAVHTVALSSSGTVVCWGDNQYGQRSVPAGLAGITQVAAGRLHSFAIKTDGSVVGWGHEEVNRLCISGAPQNLSGVATIACGTDLTACLLAPPINISMVRPISGPASGGTPITITGTNFSAGARVTIDGIAATNVTVVSSTQITATTPAGYPGEAVVAVDYGSATAFYFRPECGSDLDQNGSVDGGDLAILLLDWGPCYSNAAVPDLPRYDPFMIREEVAPETR